MSKRKDREFLLDILDAVTRIRSCMERMLFEDFVKDSKTQDAVVRNLEIVGEAVKHLSVSCRDANPENPGKASPA